MRTHTVAFLRSTKGSYTMQATMLFLALIMAGCAPVASDSEPIIQPEPTAPVIVTQLDTPTVLIILSERLGIPLEQLAAMPDDEITRLIEQNAAVLGLTIGDADERSTPESIDSAAAFLHAQYDAVACLLRESPVTAPERHWLATDNWLAVLALEAAGESDFAQRLGATLAQYEAEPHGMIEALTGAPIAWPPRAPVQREVAPSVWSEERNGNEMEDWREYADLAFYGAIAAANSGEMEHAQSIYDDALRMFDGDGFTDKAFDGRYATYKLALAMLAAQRIGIAPDAALQSRLLAQQGADGGFVAHYTQDGPVGDANTETTAYAILALTGLR